MATTTESYAGKGDGEALEATPPVPSTTPVRVTLLHQISGTRNGVDWPGPGEDVVLTADEAANLIGHGMAIPAPEPEERATAEAPAERAVVPHRQKRK